MRRSIGFVFVLTMLLATLMATRTPAQQPGAMQTELLTEVRLLRQSIETLAGTNARVQIVFGRLQLQDQRTEAAARRLDTARQAVSAVALHIAQGADAIRDLEEALTDSRRKPDEIEDLRQQLAHMRREQGRREAEHARLSRDEVEAAGAFNQEQGRWSDLNRQLEDLERALTKTQP